MANIKAPINMMSEVKEVMNTLALTAEVLSAEWTGTKETDFIKMLEMLSRYTEVPIYIREFVIVNEWAEEEDKIPSNYEIIMCEEEKNYVMLYWQTLSSLIREVENAMKERWQNNDVALSKSLEAIKLFAVYEIVTFMKKECVQIRYTTSEEEAKDSLYDLIGWFLVLMKRI